MNKIHLKLQFRIEKWLKQRNAESLDAVVKVVSCVSRFVIDSSIELCHLCFFSVDFVGSGMLRDVLPTKSFARSLIRSLQPTGAKSVVANSKRG